MDKDKQQIERDKIQKNACDLAYVHKHLLLSWATGCGKGKAVAMCIAAAWKGTGKQWLIVVPEILQIENYKADLYKHGYGWLLESAIKDIICYASLPKWKGKELNLALNEVHHLSKYKFDISQTVKFDQIISDSATVPNGVKARLYDLCPYFEYHISLNEAIQLGILPEPKVYTIGVTLDDTTSVNEYIYKGTKYRKTDKAYNKYLETQLNHWKVMAGKFNGAPWVLNKLNQTASIRKKFLAERKTERVKELLKELEDKRLIAFCGSIEQATLLGGKNAIHSKRSASVNKKVLESFNNYEIDQLFMMKMGREAMNLEGIRAVINVQLDSGSEGNLAFIQTTGRGLRSDSPEIYIVYVKESQDAVYKDRALESIDKKYIIKM